MKNISFIFLVSIILLTVGVNPASAASCDLKNIGAVNKQKQERVRVSKVIDGDTVRLSDNRLVRFIAINTPEIDHEHGDSEPLAEQARDFLKLIVNSSHKELLLVYGEDRKDRHDRLLAHVFNSQGVNIQARMIGMGLGLWITVPPNLKYMECYHRQEQLARKNNSGLWATNFIQPKSSRAITRTDRGFNVIRGKITRIGKGKKYTWLNLGTKVALRIHEKDLKYFTDIRVEQLKDQIITARGWLFPIKNQLVMQLRHPASIELE